MRGVIEIVMALIGVAMIALILNPKANTVPVVKQAGDTLTTLLATVSLQNSVGLR